MDSENIKRSLRGFINGASTIAYVTFLGYMATAIYQLTYLSYFGLDENFIELDIAKVFTSCLLIGIFLLFVTPLLVLLFRKYNSPIHKIRAVLLLGLLLVLILFLIGNKNLTGICIVLPIFFGFFILYNEVIGPLYYGKKVSGWKNKQVEYEKILKKIEGINRETPQERGYAFLKSFLEDQHIILICLTFTVIILAMICGNITSKFKNQFYVLNTSPEQLVIFKTNEGFITITYNKSLNEFEADYKILSLDYLNQNNISMELETIRSLKQPQILIDEKSIKYQLGY